MTYLSHYLAVLHCSAGCNVTLSRSYELISVALITHGLREKIYQIYDQKREEDTLAISGDIAEKHSDHTGSKG